MDTTTQIRTAAKLEANGEWQKLQRFSAEWVTGQPNNLLAWQSLGMALRNLGRLDEAIDAYTKGLRVVPKERIEFLGKPLTAGPLLFGLAHVHAQAGNHEVAKSFFKEAALVDPSVVDIWNDLGVVCMNSNDTAGAFEAFKKAVSLDARNVNSLRNLGVVYALCKVDEGVRFIHQKLATLDAPTAKAFMAQAKKLQAG